MNETRDFWKERWKVVHQPAGMATIEEGNEFRILTAEQDTNRGLKRLHFMLHLVILGRKCYSLNNKRRKLFRLKSDIEYLKTQCTYRDAGGCKNAGQEHEMCRACTDRYELRDIRIAEAKVYEDLWKRVHTFVTENKPKFSLNPHDHEPPERIDHH